MVCAFGNQEREIMRQAIKLGGHCRVGFENNLCLAEGSLAPNNAVLVNGIAGIANDQGRLADVLQAVERFKEALVHAELSCGTGRRRQN